MTDGTTQVMYSRVSGGTTGTAVGGRCCRNCDHFRMLRERGECRRYPTFVARSPGNWCGEHSDHRAEFLEHLRLLRPASRRRKSDT